jgi:GST-like protein
MIELYSRATPNGRKIVIALEEMELPYRVHAIDFTNLQQKSPEFLTLNPNGRIPVIVDTAPAGSSSPVTVFESGAILLYLAEKSGKLCPADPIERIEMLKWLFFGASQVTHTAMQVHWLVRLQEKGAAAPHLEDYRNELRRLYGVLDEIITGREWLSKGAYSIADIASWAWIERHEMHGIVIERFPALTDWLSRVGARPAIQRGYDIPPSQALRST